MNRHEWLRILAHADNQEILTKWQHANIDDSNDVTYTWLREPEIGLLPLQARTGNTGDKFLFGDATITRAVVQVNEKSGYSFIMGRDKTTAKVCAKIDALMQDSQFHKQLIKQILTPLEISTKTRQQQEKIAVDNTKVDFFTMVRGD